MRPLRIGASQVHRNHEATKDVGLGLAELMRRRRGRRSPRISVRTYASHQTHRPGGAASPSSSDIARPTRSRRAKPCRWTNSGPGDGRVEEAPAARRARTTTRCVHHNAGDYGGWFCPRHVTPARPHPRRSRKSVPEIPPASSRATRLSGASGRPPPPPPSAPGKGVARCYCVLGGRACSREGELLGSRTSRPGRPESRPWRRGAREGGDVASSTIAKKPQRL